MDFKFFSLALFAAMLAMLAMLAVSDTGLLAEQPSVVAADESAGITEPQRRVLIREIDPQGISGSLVLAGKDVPATTVSTFFKLANRKQPQVVVLQFGQCHDGHAVLQRLLGGWQRSETAKIEWFGIRSRKDAGGDRVVAAIRIATGVWIVAESPQQIRELAAASAVDTELRKLLVRGGVVGGSAAAAETIASVCFRDDETPACVAGLGLLPAALVETEPTGSGSDARLARVVPQHTAHVGYEIRDGAALVVRGRWMHAEGDGEVTIYLPAGASRPAVRRVMRDRQRRADLTTLRKIAIDRLGPQFPPAKPDPPCLKDGTLIIIGGGGMPKGLLQRFVKAAGGKRARIVVFPTAMPDPLPEKSGIADLLRREGAQQVTVLPGRTRAEVESPAFLAVLREATGIWFGGGRQWRFVDAYLDTKAHALMHGVLRRGGVIAGSSAGASIQAEYMARGNPLGNLDIMAEGYERGLGFLSGAAIDQHFTQRGRRKDMTKLVGRYPQLLGIGIDESTAIVVSGCVAEVVGKNVVCFYDGNKPVEGGEVGFVMLRPGGRYDLKARKVLEPDADAEPTSPDRQPSMANVQKP